MINFWSDYKNIDIDRNYITLINLVVIIGFSSGDVMVSVIEKNTGVR